MLHTPPIFAYDDQPSRFETLDISSYYIKLSNKIKYAISYLKKNYLNIKIIYIDLRADEIDYAKDIEQIKSLGYGDDIIEPSSNLAGLVLYRIARLLGATCQIIFYTGNPAFTSANRNILDAEIRKDGNSILLDNVNHLEERIKKDCNDIALRELSQYKTEFSIAKRVASVNKLKLSSILGFIGADETDLIRHILHSLQTTIQERIRLLVEVAAIIDAISDPSTEGAAERNDYLWTCEREVFGYMSIKEMVETGDLGNIMATANYLRNWTR